MSPFIVPVSFFLITGLVILVAIYFKSRERQMLIERGLSAEQIKEFFSNKKSVNPYLMTKIGIVSIFFGLALFLGMFLEDLTSRDYWMVLSLFSVTGAGFIIANVVGRKLDNGTKEIA